MNKSGILNPKNAPASRRDFLYGLGTSLGSMALTHQWAVDASNAFPSSMLPKEPMLPGKAKACILLFMEGGPGHMDTFDPKPELQARHTTQSHRTAGLANGYRFFVGSPFASRKVGQSGLDMSAPWVHLAHPDVADEWCNYRGCHAESLNHPEALFHMNTGSRLGTDPALGSWVPGFLGDLWSGLHQPESARLRGHDRAGCPTGWSGQLEPGVSTGHLSRHPAQTHRFTHPQSPATRPQDPRTRPK